MLGRLALAVLAPALAFSATNLQPACAVRPINGNWAQSAQFISGLNAIAGSDEQNRGWSDYSKVSASDWRKLQKRYLDRIEAWRERALGGSLPALQVAFYPFGGPDAANLLAFYPEAKTYVIVGLEPVGCIPSNLQDYTPAYFAELRANLSSVVANGFFRTKEMGGNFKAGTVNGVLPLILYVLARSGFTVGDVSPIGIGANAPQAKPETAGVAIRFSDARHGARTLTYLACNLQNARLQRKPTTVKYLNDLPPAATLVKSASYLMHKPYFSNVRNLILAKSTVIVEDDSGIPYRY